MELRTADTKDVEEEKLQKKCRTCHAPNVVLVRLNGGEHTARTQTLMAACSNTSCHRYVDVDRVKTWVRKNELILAAQQPKHEKDSIQ